MSQNDIPAAVTGAQGAIEAGLDAVLSAVEAVEARCKDAFLPLLREHGIARVEVHYDGGGDEGTVGEVRPIRLTRTSIFPRSSATITASNTMGRSRRGPSASRTH
jgi:hypothetical protein